MLAERLSKAWRARQAMVPVRSAMAFGPEGLVLGARTVLAPADTDRFRPGIRLEGREARMIALLSAALLRPVSPQALNHLRKAAEHWSDGRAALAEIHLALSGVNALDDGAGAQRLFLADGLLEEGVEPEAILKALGLDPGLLASLAKDYHTQPRVPKGSGRPSGQWTVDGTGGEASDEGGGSDDGEPEARLIPARYERRPEARPTEALQGPSPRPSPTSPVVEPPRFFTPPVPGRPWFVGLTKPQLIELGLFILRFAGPTVALGTAFIPFSKSLRQDGTMPGWPPLHFQWHTDERELVLSYLDQNLRHVTKTAELGPDGLFYDVDRKVIGRFVPDGGIVIDRSAVLPQEARGKDEPSFCPKPVPDKDHGNQNGLAYENYMKALINPGNPTPSGFGIAMTNPGTGNPVILDDCQRRSGILFDYKGTKYTKLLSFGLRGRVLMKLIGQADRQISSSVGWHIVWIFEEKSAMEEVEKEFNKLPKLRGKIQFDYEPMPGFSI